MARSDAILAKLDWSVIHAVAWNGLDDFRSFSGFLANLCGMSAADS